MRRLYLVVRSDLSPGQQAVQACHALRGFVEEHPEADREWFKESNTLVLLAVPNERSLRDLGAKAMRAGIPFTEFREPDIGNEVTATAIAPAGRRLCRRLPLAMLR
jgi:peptidyl-tRNA hydrolase